MTHTLDEALTLTPGANAGESTARTHPAWANMVGPFGGTTAAVALRAVLDHPEAQGRPAALTVNFAAPIADGEYTLIAESARTNRSNQHWVVRGVQDGATVFTATVLLASGRETFADTEATMPDVPKPADIAPVTRDVPLKWLSQYEMRFVEGMPPATAEQATDSSLTRLWSRFSAERPWDYEGLACTCDMFFPRIFARVGSRTAAGTVSYTVYFHSTPEELAAQGPFVLGEAQGGRFESGLFDQTARLWSEAGTLLATTHQLVYFK